MAEATDQITTPSSSSDELQLTITHHGTPHIFTLPSTSTISDLSTAISNDLSIPSSHQKLLITPRVGLLRAPFKDPTLPLSTLTSKKILLMGSTAAEVSQITSASTTSHEQSLRRAAGGPIKPATPSRTHNLTRTLEEAQYTFHTLRPLPYLPDPSRSLALLSRLRSDPGIKATMRRHKFSVPLLTEMDPAAHTTHASRTLGLNRNRGEVIELRLRTDAGDGYRDYKTIRRTLCHELAHNVWGEHDGRFWELCRRIEREVERDDWTRGGRSVGEEVFYEPDVVADHGGWTGGEFVLGGGNVVVGGQTGRVEGGADGGMSRRDILARAAEERARAGKRAEQEGGAQEGKKPEGTA